MTNGHYDSSVLKRQLTVPRSVAAKAKPTPPSSICPVERAAAWMADFVVVGVAHAHERWLEVVVARNRVPRRDQARQFVMDDAKLFRRAVVGVVPWQKDEIDSFAGIAVHLIDDAAQIDMVLQTRVGDVQVSDLKETQRLFSRVRHRIDL
jgi:hypothetical protein